MMTMKNPSHPGPLVKHECLEPLGLTVTAGASVLGVTRKTLSELVNGRAGISPEMAVAGKSLWQHAARMARHQTAYDLSRIDPAQIKVKLYAPETRQESRVV